MSIEERINLIGKVIGETDNNNYDFEEIAEDEGNTVKERITLSYTNNTGYKLRVSLYESASAQGDDYNSGSFNFYWELDSNIEVTDTDGIENNYSEIIGYGCSNNSQYDHRTFDTVTGERFIDVNDGDELTLTTTLIWHNVNSSSGSGDHSRDMKFIRSRMMIVGALEV